MRLRRSVAAGIPYGVHEHSPPRRRLRLRRGRRPARRDRPARRGGRSRVGPPDAARGHRLRKDLHDGEGHREGGPAGAGARPQQDPGRAALRGDARVLPAQRRRVLRLLLRLLPAGSLRPLDRHLHREGRLDQRPHRADAALGDEGAAGARRLHHRRHRVLDLRPRGPGLVPRDGPAPGPGRDRRSALHPPAPRRDAVHAERGRAAPRNVPGARRSHRRVSGGVGEGRGTHRALRRRDREPEPFRSPDRGGGAPRAQAHDLSQEPLRHAARAGPRSHRSHQGRADRAPRGASRGEQARRGATSGAAHPVRPGDDDRDRPLQGDRELLALPLGPPPRRAAADPVRLPSVRRAPVHRREPRHRAAARGHVPRRPLAQGNAGRVRIPSPVGARQPAVALRRVRTPRPPGGLRVRDAGTLRGEARGRGGGAARSSHGARRPPRRGASRIDPGGRPPLRDPPPHRRRRAGAGDDADEADGRGPH